MLLQSIFVAAGLLLGLCAPSSATAPETPFVEQDGQGDTITGRIYDVIHGSDGYTYFLLDDKPMAMKTAAFPDPTPAEGTKMTATGVTVDPSGWGYLCTGLS